MEPSELDSFDLLMQFSEESGELIQAISKLVRKEVGTNPTPVSLETCLQNLVEEIADVAVVSDTLLEHWKISLEDFEQIKSQKKRRWRERLNQ